MSVNLTVTLSLRQDISGATRLISINVLADVAYGRDIGPSPAG